MDKPNYYSILPAIVRYDNDLKPNEKLLYIEITALMDFNGYCWASNKYFADLYGVGKETVSRWINHLKEKEYLDITIIRNEKNEIVYRKIYAKVFNNYTEGIDNLVNNVLTKNNSTYCEKSALPIDKKGKENTIYNNNINISNIYSEKDETKENNNKNANKYTNKLYSEIIAEYSENAELKVLLFDFLEMRKELKRPMTGKAFYLLLAKLDKLANDDKTKINLLEQSIENSWLNVYPINDNANRKVGKNNTSKKTNNIFLEMLMENGEV